MPEQRASYLCTGHVWPALIASIAGNYDVVSVICITADEEATV